jgi:hypothetical protein
MMGCKECDCEDGTDGGRRHEQSECLDLSIYGKLTTLNEKAEWLRNYGRVVCKEVLYQSALNDHEIKNIQDFKMEESTALKTSWSEINDSIKNYPLYKRYLSFNQEANSKVIKNIKTVEKYDTIVPCFSLALLKAIAEKKGEDAKFEFIHAEGNSGPTVVIKVTSGSATTAASDTFYDYSDEPKDIFARVKSAL